MLERIKERIATLRITLIAMAESPKRAAIPPGSGGDAFLLGVFEATRKEIEFLESLLLDYAPASSTTDKKGLNLVSIEEIEKSVRSILRQPFMETTNEPH